jgi:hypothetical protein
MVYLTALLVAAVATVAAHTITVPTKTSLANVARVEAYTLAIVAGSARIAWEEALGLGDAVSSQAYTAWVEAHCLADAAWKKLALLDYDACEEAAWEHLNCWVEDKWVKAVWVKAVHQDETAC